MRVDKYGIVGASISGMKKTRQENELLFFEFGEVVVKWESDELKCRMANLNSQVGDRKIGGALVDFGAEGKVENEELIQEMWMQKKTLGV